MRPNFRTISLLIHLCSKVKEMHLQNLIQNAAELLAYAEELEMRMRRPYERRI